MPIINVAEDLTRAGGVSTSNFYSVFSRILEGVFELLSVPIFGIPLYVVFICIGVVSAIFALLSNKKGGDGN